jgi:hypothetical protein
MKVGVVKDCSRKYRWINQSLLAKAINVCVKEDNYYLLEAENGTINVVVFWHKIEKLERKRELKYIHG